MRPSILLLSLVIADGPASPAHGQKPATVIVRSRSSEWSNERVFTVVQPAMVDTFALRRVTRRFRPTGPVLRVPRSAISEMRVQTDRTRREGMRMGAFTGLFSGALSGIMVGALFAALGGEFYPRGTDRPGVHPLFLTVPLTAAIVATGGALAGAAFPGKRWQRVDPRSWRLPLPPSALPERGDDVPRHESAAEVALLQHRRQ